MTPLAQKRHILQLAREVGVADLEWVAPPSGWFDFGAQVTWDRYMKTYDIFTDGYSTPYTPTAAYFVALHEMGHVALGHTELGNRRYFERRLELETEAWEWALATAKTEPDEAALRAMKSGIESYWWLRRPEEPSDRYLNFHSQHGLADIAYTA